MKKKITVAALVICLVSILVGTSLAYFMDTDEATNTFTVGSVDIEQVEDFDKDTAQLLPVVGEDPTVATDNYIEKNVTVKNTGKNDAYVQTYVAVPAVLDNEGTLKLYDGNLTDKKWEKELVATGVAITGETLTYNVYRYRYTEKLTKTNVTTACLEYVYIDSLTNLKTYDTDNDGTVDKAHFVDADGTVIEAFDATGNLNVYVATQAVQSDGFSSADAALGTAFTKHPWE